MLAGLVVDLFALDPIRSLFYAAILNGVAAPPLIVLMILLGRDRNVLGEHRSGALSLTLTVITVAVSVALPIAYLLRPSLARAEGCGLQDRAAAARVSDGGPRPAARAQSSSWHAAELPKLGSPRCSS